MRLLLFLFSLMSAGFLTLFLVRAVSACTWEATLTNNRTNEVHHFKPGPAPVAVDVAKLEPSVPAACLISQVHKAKNPDTEVAWIKCKYHSPGTNLFQTQSQVITLPQELSRVRTTLNFPGLLMFLGASGVPIVEIRLACAEGPLFFNNANAVPEQPQ